RKVIRSVPASRSQTFTVLSRPAVSSVLPPGRNTVVLIPSLCPFRTRWTLPLALSRSLTSLSYSPVARVLPSGEKETERTPSPHRPTTRPFRELTSQRPAAPPGVCQCPSAAARVLPSGEKATARTLLPVSDWKGSGRGPKVRGSPPTKAGAGA